MEEKNEDDKKIYEYHGFTDSGQLLYRNRETGEWWAGTKNGPKKLKEKKNDNTKI